jgi:hypothetical protein
MSKTVFFFLLLSCASLLNAQSARLGGDVSDPSGAAISGASVTLVNQGTRAQLHTRTASAGEFVFPSVLPGIYNIQVEANGFKSVTRSGIKLDVTEVARLRIAMEVGTVSERLEITAEAAPVIVTSQSVESEVTREQIATLPLNGRDFNQLVLLAAGAVDNINSGNGRDFGSVAANGNRAFSNDYTIDGAPNNDLYQGKSALPISIDTIQEFKVTSGAASAQYGQAGTQITLVTRGGTNHFHGSAFEYYRGDALQARNTFSTTAPPPFSRHQFGGSFGGPVLLPRYNGHNRTFFFLNYEGNLQSSSATRVATVPPDAFWKGDFSSLLARNIQLRDPYLPTKPNIPGNRLDLYLGGARISKIAEAMQPFWGSPNLPGLTNNSAINASSTNNMHQFTSRVDQLLPRNQQFSARLSYARLDASAPDLIGTSGAGLLTPISNWNGTLSWSAPWTPSLFNEARFGVSDYNSLTLYNNGNLPTVESLGMSGFTPVSNLFPALPRITFSGGDAFTQLNYGGDSNFGMAALVKQSRTYNWADTIIWNVGGHTIRAGVELRHTVLPSLQTSNARGSLSFTASSTGVSSGYGFADFLMGVPSSTQQVPVRPELLLRQSDVASYIQDDWRVSRRMTLYAGLRHELYLSPTEEHNRITTFDPVVGGIVVASDGGKLPVDYYVPTVVQKLAPKGTFPFPVVPAESVGLDGRHLVNTQWKNFGPRAGLAFDLLGDGRTMLRSGYGIFYTRYPIQYLQQTAFVNPPFAGVFNYSQSLAGGQPLLTLAAPYPSTGGGPSVAPAGMERNFRQPYNQEWNMTLEHQFGQSTVVSLGYVGNKGTHLFRSTDANGPRLDPVTNKVVRPFSSTFGTSAIAYRLTNGNSIYNAMLFEVRRRVARGFAVQGNWTWANGMDDTGQTVNNALLDVQNLGRDRARSDYVRHHQVTINGTYDLPIGQGHYLLGNMPRWANTAFGGWRLSGILRDTTGRYFTPSFTAAGGLSNNRPDVVPGVQANLPSDQRSPEHWFNAAAFVPVPATDPVTGLPRFGNAGRNTLVGPGLAAIDASLAKVFRLRENGLAATFRLEAFNLFNHPNYDLPQSNISQTNLVGVINNTTVDARQVQFAFRVDF